jgi:hypothetical protein
MPLPAFRLSRSALPFSSLSLRSGWPTIVGVYAIIGWMLTQTVQGWTSQLLMFLLFSSVQLICISIVGEYVGRIYKQRPLYVVKAVCAQSQPRQFEFQYSANNP